VEPGAWWPRPAQELRALRAQASTAYHQPCPSQRQPEVTVGSGQCVGVAVLGPAHEAAAAPLGCPGPGVVPHCARLYCSSRTAVAPRFWPELSCPSALDRIAKGWASEVSGRRKSLGRAPQRSSDLVSGSLRGPLAGCGPGARPDSRAVPRPAALPGQRSSTLAPGSVKGALHPKPDHSAGRGPATGAIA
jgi:hypothetical protein